MDLVTLLDTNICLYYLSGQLIDQPPDRGLCVSVMTEIELLSFSEIRQPELAAVQSLLNSVSIIGIDDTVVAETVRLRREHRLRLPDSVIAATASVLDADFWTNDRKLAAIVGERAIVPALR